MCHAATFTSSHHKESRNSNARLLSLVTIFVSASSLSILGCSVCELHFWYYINDGSVQSGTKVAPPGTLDAKGQFRDCPGHSGTVQGWQPYIIGQESIVASKE